MTAAREPTSAHDLRDFPKHRGPRFVVALIGSLGILTVLAHGVEAASTSADGRLDPLQELIRRTSRSPALEVAFILDWGPGTPAMHYELAVGRPAPGRLSAGQGRWAHLRITRNDTGRLAQELLADEKTTWIWRSATLDLRAMCRDRLPPAAWLPACLGFLVSPAVMEEGLEEAKILEPPAGGKQTRLVQVEHPRPACYWIDSEGPRLVKVEVPATKRDPLGLRVRVERWNTTASLPVEVFRLAGPTHESLPTGSPLSGRREDRGQGTPSGPGVSPNETSQE